MKARQDWARIILFSLPILFVSLFLLLPLLLTFVVSFWERVGFIPTATIMERIVSAEDFN